MRKAAYETFTTALTTLWLHDKLADELVPSLNVTWTRTAPTVVMGGVSEGMAYVHCPDAAMGMNIQGDTQNVKYFRSLCSLMLSEVENEALGFTGLQVNSSLSTVVSGILNGETFQIVFDEDANTATLSLVGNELFKIIIDLETWLVEDIIDHNGFQFKGAETINSTYCFHEQLTDNLTSELSSLIQNLSGQNVFMSPLIFGPIFAGAELGAGEGLAALCANPLAAALIGTFAAIFFIGNYLCDQYEWLPPRDFNEDCKTVLNILKGPDWYTKYAIDQGENAEEAWDTLLSSAGGGPDDRWRYVAEYICKKIRENPVEAVLLTTIPIFALIDNLAGPYRQLNRLEGSLNNNTTNNTT